MACKFSKLGDIAEVIDSLHKTPKYSDTGYPMVRCTDVKYGRLSLDRVFFVDDNIFKEFSRRYSPQTNDIIITRVGSYGNTALVEDINFCLGQNTSAIVSKINPRFLYFTLNSPMVKQQIEFSVVGSTQKTLSLKAIKNLDIPRFDPAIEDRIADIIGVLDDKIELNRQINQTLEQIAQTIFKSWFVDFEPVKAKIAAKAAGHDPERAAMCAISGKTAAELDQLTAEQRQQLAATAALFPDELVESELGLVPVGWEVSTLGKYLEVKRGGSPRPIKDFIVKEGLPWVKIADATAVPGPFLFRTKEFIKQEGLKKTVLLKKGALILSNSATPGLPKFLELDACIHDGWLHFPKRELFSDVYLYQLFLKLRTELVSQGNGSVFTNLKTDILRNQLVVAPTERVISKFDEIALPLLDTSREICIEIDTLSKIRDALLPKLLSGELPPLIPPMK